MASLIQSTIPLFNNSQSLPSSSSYSYSDVPCLHFKNPSLKNLEFPKRVLFYTNKKSICKSSLDEVTAVEPPPKLDDKSKAQLIGSLKIKLLVRNYIFVSLLCV